MRILDINFCIYLCFRYFYRPSRNRAVQFFHKFREEIGHRDNSQGASAMSLRPEKLNTSVPSGHFYFLKSLLLADTLAKEYSVWMGTYALVMHACASSASRRRFVSGTARPNY